MSTDRENIPYDWQVPPQAAPESRRLGFLNEATEEGLAWLRSQRGYRDWPKALDTLAGMDTVNPPAGYRSRINPNRLKRNTREIIGSLAKLRPMWGYHSDNKAYKPNANMMNKVTRALYLEEMFDLDIKEALAYASATCSGFVRPIYRRDMAGTGRGGIKLLSYGQPCILPLQLPSNNDYQSAYAVTILDEMPIFMAHAMFPRFQSLLRPKSSRYWYANDGVRGAAQGNILQRMFGKGTARANKDAALSDLLIPIRYTYILDLSINTTGREIPMGEPNSSWFYKVPHVGQKISTGTDIRTGHETFRTADENDARLYPHRRLIISSDNCIPYDGPAFDWHGMVPLVRFCMDSWPWEPIGFSLVHDGYEINESLKELYRGAMDKVRSQNDMSLAYDINSVSKREAEQFDPMQPRARVGYDGQAIEGQPFQPVVPPEVLKISTEHLAFIEKLENVLDSQQAVQDAASLAKLRAVGSMDDMEKILEANGPIIEDMSRSMEPPMRDLGNMIKYLVLQYLTTARVMQYVGEDGVTPEIMDYDPSSLVPSHAPGENPGDSTSPQPSRYTARERARIFADNLRFFIMPNSLHELTQMTMKLGLVQLKKAGVMIDSQTIAEAWNVPNYGDIEGNTVIERYHSEQEQQLMFAARMKELAAAEGLMPSAPPGAGAPGAKPPGAPGPGGAQPEGRPASFTAAPALKSKDGGARSTIATSK